MKKVLAVLLAAALVLSLSVAAFATVPPTALSGAEIDGDQSGDVKVQLKDKNGESIETDKVYKVSIIWKDMTFTFKTDQAKEEIVWDPETHTFGDMSGKWMVGDAETNTITEAVTLKNHSNAEVTYGFKFENATPDLPTSSQLTAGVTATLSVAEGTLATAEGTTVDNAPSASADVSVPADAVPTMLSTFTVDTVIVTLTK